MVILWVGIVMLPLGARVYDLIFPWEIAHEPGRLVNQDGSREFKPGDQLRWVGEYEILRHGCTGVFRRTLNVTDPDTGTITPIFFPSHPGSVPLEPSQFRLRGLLVERIPEAWKGHKLSYHVIAEIDCWSWIPGTLQTWRYPPDSIAVIGLRAP